MRAFHCCINSVWCRDTVPAPHSSLFLADCDVLCALVFRQLHVLGEKFPGAHGEGAGLRRTTRGGPWRTQFAPSCSRCWCC